MTGPLSASRPFGLARQHDEAGGVVGFVLDVLGQRVERVDLGSQPRRDGGTGLVAGLRDLARRARGIGGHHRPDAELADDLAALAERVDVAFHGLDVRQPRALDGEQLMAHRHEMLGHDMQP